MTKKRCKRLLVFTLVVCILFANVLTVFAETVNYSTWNGESLYNVDMTFSDDTTMSYRDYLTVIDKYYIRFHAATGDIAGTDFELSYMYGSWSIDVTAQFYYVGTASLNAFSKDTASLIIDDSVYSSTGKVNLILDVPWSYDNTSMNGGTTDYFNYRPVSSSGDFRISFSNMNWFNMMQDFGKFESNVYYKDDDSTRVITEDLGFTIELAGTPSYVISSVSYMEVDLHFRSDSFYFVCNEQGGYWWSSEFKLEYIADIGKLAITVSDDGIIKKSSEVDGSYAIGGRYLKQGDILSSNKVYLLTDVIYDSTISYDNSLHDFDVSTMSSYGPYQTNIGNESGASIYVDGLCYSNLRFSDSGSGKMIGFNPFINTTKSYKVDNICLNSSSTGPHLVIFLSTYDMPATEITYKNFYTDEVIEEPDDISDGVNLPSGYKYFIDQYNNFIDTDSLSAITNSTTVYCVPTIYKMPYFNGTDATQLGTLDLTIDESTLETQYSNTEFVSVKYGSTEPLNEIASYWSDEKGNDIASSVVYGTKAYKYESDGGTAGCETSNTDYRISIPGSCSLANAHNLADTRGELINVFEGVNKLEFDLKNYKYYSEYYLDVKNRISSPLTNGVGNTSGISVLYAGDYQILFTANTSESGNCSSGVFIVEPGDPGKAIVVDIYEDAGSDVTCLGDVLANTEIVDLDSIRASLATYNSGAAITLTDDGKLVIESDDIRMFPRGYDTSGIEGDPSTVPLDSSDFCEVFYSKEFTKSLVGAGIGHDFTNATWTVMPLTEVPTLADLNAFINSSIYNKADLVVPEYYGLIEKIEIAQCARDASLCTSTKPVVMRITTSNTAPVIKKSGETLTGTNNESIDTTTLTITDAEGDLVTVKVDGAERTVTNHNSMDIMILPDDQLHTITAIDSEDNETEIKIKVLTHAPCIVDTEGNSLGSTILSDLQFKVADLKNDVVSVTDNGEEITADDSGIYTISASSEGDKEHVIVAKDAANNETTCTVLLKHKCTGGTPTMENRIAETCTEDGSYDEVVHCRVCDTVLSTTPKTIDRLGHRWTGDWENTEYSDTLLQNAENNTAIQSLWENDGYHRLQVKYCSNSSECSRGSTEKAYNLRVLKFEYVYNPDEDGDGKPDVEIKVKDVETDSLVDTIDTTVTELPVVESITPDVDSYVPYEAKPKTNSYGFTTSEIKKYSIPEVKVTIGTSSWRKFINTITFGVFFKETQVGSITTEYKGSENLSSVINTGYFVAKNGTIYDSNSIKEQTFVDGARFTLTKEESEKFVVYTKVVLDCGYTIYTSSDGVVIDTISPTIELDSNENFDCLFDTEIITVKDNYALKSVIIDGVEESITGKEKAITLNNDNGSHTIKVIDKAGNESIKTFRFKEKPSATDFDASVKGKLIDVDGKPIVGATVELHSTVRTTTTNENGEFYFDNVEVEKHSLTASVNGTTVYDIDLEMTPIYASATVNEVSNSFSVSSSYVYSDTSLLMIVDAAECENHVHGRVEIENEVSPTCTIRGSHDVVDYCPNCNGIYSKVSEFVDPLGHLWNDDSWVLVEEDDRTDALYNGAINTVDKTQLNYNHALFRRDCGRSDVYELSIKEIAHTCTPTTPIVENRIEPDCITDGSYDEVVYCGVCNSEISRTPHTLTKLGHDWDAGTITKEPKCTEDGTKTYECNRCDATKDVDVNKLGHNGGTAVKENNVDPTCTSDGSYDEVVYCTRCNAELSRDNYTVDALGHDDAEPIIENRVYPTCTTDGSYDEVVYCDRCDVELSRDTKIITKLGHVRGTPVIENRVEPTCTTAGSYEEVVYCSTCHSELQRTPKRIDATGHHGNGPVYENVVGATCTIKGSYDVVIYCKDCNAELSRTQHTDESLGHAWDEGVITKQPTCTEDGVKLFTCTRCGDTYTEKINKLGHTEGSAIRENVVKATCVTKGHYDEVVYCTVCNAELNRKYYEQEALGHDWDKGEITKQPSCTVEGIKTYNCKRCDKTRQETVTELGHTEGTPVIETLVNPTCTTKGSFEEVVYCERCGTELSRVGKNIEALGHKEGKPVYENVIKASCIVKGSFEEVVYCERCDTELSRVLHTDEALGHDWKKDSVTKQPTCTEEGSVKYKCARCDLEKEESLSALGHSWDAEWELCDKVTDEIFEECENSIEKPESLESYNVYKQICSRSDCECYQLKLKEKEPEKEPDKTPDKEPDKEPEKDKIGIDEAVTEDKKDIIKVNADKAPKTDDAPIRAWFIEFVFGLFVLRKSIKNSIKRNRRL